MAVRIYSLAKELKIDSKELVDICPRAGVSGKGSALASLTDDEVETIKKYLSGSTAARTARPTTSAGPASSALSPRPTSIRREDYIAPAGTPAGKPVVLGARPERIGTEQKKKAGAEEGSKPLAKGAPTIKLAPMPAAPQPTLIPKADEPAPQKPDIKLPPDAIRASKAGTTPLSEHIRKQEARRMADSGAAPLPGAVGPSKARPKRLPLESESTGLRGRGRRGGRSDGAPAEEGESTGLGGREQRQLKRKRTGTVARKGGADDDTPSFRRRPMRTRRGGVSTAAPRKSNVVIELPCSVRTFSESLGVPARQVLAKLLSLGAATVNINSEIDANLGDLLAMELGIEVDFRQPTDRQEQLLAQLDVADDSAEQLEPRPPVVTFLGHVDHGKTSLLDRILSLNVAGGESGGITQHIRAYMVQREGRRIAFVDTPGHEAFTEMRARGANVTDIAVLVVAADDGVMPQTEEAISHARAAGVPIVVALNKIDLPGVKMDRILQDLATNDLLPTQWGGDTEVVPCSALTGQGVPELIETLLTIAELHDYRANPHRPADGTCLEAELHEGRGVVAKLLVKRGMLHVGDVIVCGAAFGRVKAMYDTLRADETLAEAGPSTPVNVTGLHIAPAAGDRFVVLNEIADARAIAEKRAQTTRQAALAGTTTHVTLENLFERLEHTGEVQTLNLILRADVRGSIEAIRKELTKLDHPEVQIRILQATVGGITGADVHLADASDAIIIGFNVVADEGARTLADEKGVQIRRYEIIYQVTDDLKAALEGMLKPERREVDSGRALVLRTFNISRLGTVAGCRVLSGTIERNARVRLIRDSRIIGDYALESLRREKDDVREVREGFECGMKLAGFNDLKESDLLEAYRVEEVARTI